MPFPPRHARAALVLLCGALATTACERAAPPARDTGAAANPAIADSGSRPPVNSGWNADAGPVLLVASDAAEVAEVIFPEVTDSTFGDSTLLDLAPVRGARVLLLSRHGQVGTAIVAGEDTTAQADSAEESCEDWPLVRLRGERGDTPASWTVAFIGNNARALPLDSIEGMSRADSSRLAGEVARLARALPNDTARAFRGLPYFVRTVRRFTAAPGVEALVADVSRRINQEANPREEQILLVAEREKAGAPWQVAFAERASGRDGNVETHDVLAAAAIGPTRRPTLVLGRYVGDGVSYAILERTGTRQWTIRWVSATSGC
ncbi:MAG TPA: hypothetical protein VHM67_04890 [Gemmatimonadaceae bacterium]|nr:hypothetical protein [Gemmatimonadaceae bacterium]